MSFYYHSPESTTLNQYPSTTEYYTSLTTGFVDFEKRATSSSESKSSSTSSRHHSTTSACTDKQRCETGSSVSGRTIALAVVIPVIVFVLVIAFFMFRSYKKGKKEAETDNDPDFYGETTILPDYPGTRLNEMKAGTNHRGGDFDTQSYYSNNPFTSESARYPANALLPPSRNVDVNYYSNTSSNDPYYNDFSLPQQHQLGSSHSLNNLAKHIGSEYSAYPIDSRPSSRMGSPYRSPNSSVFNVSQTNTTNNKNVRNLTTEKTLSQEEQTDSSNSYKEYKNPDQLKQRDYHNSHSVSDDEEDVISHEDVFHDPVAKPNSHFDISPVKDHYRQTSDASYVANQPEILSSRLSDDELEDVARNAPKSNAKTTEPQDEEEEDENIKRMKSVYRVYFDRDDSIRRPPTSSNDPVPPLPTIRASDVQDIPEQDDHYNIEKQEKHQQEQLEKQEKEQQEEQEAEDSVGDLNSTVRHGKNDSLHASETNDANFLSTGDHLAESKHHNRAVSSIYSSIPLGQFSNTPDLPHDQIHQYQQTQQDQYYPQGQYPQQDPEHEQYYQQQQQHGQYYPQQYPPNQYPQGQAHIYQPPNQRGFQSQRINAPVALKPLQQLPNPSKLDDPVTNTDYAPTRSLTAGTRPPDLSIKPFNPMHYADQIFQPASPTTASSFANQPSDAAPPSPHHIRQSVVMFNPVEIGKPKIYRPAGSFSQYNSANSSRNGSMTSMSAYQDPNSSKAELLPSSGSQADLRKHLGSHEDYHIAP